MHGSLGSILLLATLTASPGHTVEATMDAFERICAEGDRQAAAEWLEAMEIDERARDLERLLAAGDAESRIVALFRLGRMLDAEEASRIAREARAGASLQPRLLAGLLIACSKLGDPGEACADLPDRIVALEPSNAWGWMVKAQTAYREGDHAGARQALLASGRSSQYLSPDREMMRMVWNDLRDHPPSAALASARRSSVLQARAGDPEGPMICDMSDPLHDAASTALGYVMGTPSQPFMVLRQLCGTAAAAQDGELLAACRRLARMIEDQAFSYVEARFALRLRSEIGTQAELGAAMQREAELQTLYEALADRARVLETLQMTPEVIDLLLERDEIAYWRWLVDQLEPDEPDAH